MERNGLTRREFAAAAAGAAAWEQPAKRRLRRAESYFGLHFDLHPNEKDTVLGRDVTPEAVGRLLDRVQPDFVQYDAKGHPGLLGWPSEVGPSAPGIVRDSLAVWRAETAKRGVALYIHFSGVWDSEAVRRHPEWARVTPEGKPDTRQTSTFGPYVDLLMIPQLREAATKYELDGAWVDGECWAAHADYCEAALRAFGRQAPRKAGEPGWLEWLEFQREQFRRYVRHYVEELHRSHPQFQIASNWLYSTMVPEEPALPVDFLSGDYLGNASISTARLEARYLAQTGKPWDLMAWGFQQADSNRVGHVFKPAVQLMQEAGVVLAQSGGFQVYYHPARSGHFEEPHIETMAALARHCRRLQRWSQGTETVPQIGVVFSKESLYRTSNKLFGGWGRLPDPARGWVDLLLECQWSVDVLPDWKLGRVAERYPVVVLPDWEAPGEECLETLLRYAQGGGFLVASGAHNAARLAERLGMRASGEPSRMEAWLRHGVLGNATGLWLDLDPGAGQVLDWRYGEVNTTREGKSAAVEAALGQGRVVVIPGPVGSVFAATHAAAVREFGRTLIGRRFQPLVRVTAPPTVEVVLRRKGGETLVHLLNTTAMQVAGEYATVDFVPPLGPVTLAVRGRMPRGARLEPGGGAIGWRRAGNDEWKAVIPRLELHTVAVMVI
ncbi:MAG: alpha-amylase family protein [Bryobacteraceae bacterium]